MRVFFSLWLLLLVITGTAFAFSPDGKYIFKESGCSGTMEVTEQDFGMDPHIMVEISTVCTDQAHTCDFKAKGERVISTDNSFSANFVSLDNDESTPAGFSVEFTPYGASIDVRERGPFCGLNAYYSGKWVKEGVKQPAAKNKSKEVTAICSEYIKIKKECYKKAKKGMMPDKAIAGLKKSKMPVEGRDEACRDGFAAYGRAGSIPDAALSRALQQDFSQCYEALTKEQE